MKRIFMSEVAQGFWQFLSVTSVGQRRHRMAVLTRVRGQDTRQRK